MESDLIVHLSYRATSEHLKPGAGVLGDGYRWGTNLLCADVTSYLSHLRVCLSATVRLVCCNKRDPSLSMIRTPLFSDYASVSLSVRVLV